MDVIIAVNDSINSFIWGIPGITMVLITGLIFTFKLDFLQFRYLFRFMKETVLKSSDGKSFLGELVSFKAAMVSISAMVGSGNIAGVATAVVMGGPGALVWMVLAAFIGMITKFAEICLSLKYRHVYKDGHVNGGPMHYIEKGLGMKWLAIVYAVFTIFYAFVVTALVDSNTIALSLNGRFGIDTVYVGIFLSVVTALVVMGGVKSIGNVCKVLSPFMAGAYLFSGFLVLLFNYERIPESFSLIFHAAFNPAAYTGGAIGSFLLSLRYGFARGIFSNDAGLGASGIIHATAKVDHPVRQAMWGPCEVFLDTVMICCMSGLVIVLSGCWQNGESGGVLAISAFENLMPGYGGLICLAAVCFFGFSCTLSFW